MSDHPEMVPPCPSIRERDGLKCEKEEGHQGLHQNRNEFWSGNQELLN